MLIKPEGGQHREAQRFAEEGFELYRDVIPEKHLASAQCVLETWVDQVIGQWHSEGLLTDSFADLGFSDRLFQAWLAAGEPKEPVTTQNRLSSLGDQFAAFIDQPTLQQLSSRLLGSESVAPIDISFYRAVFPHQAEGALPWHQDAQCLDGLSENFVTFWIPLVDVNPVNSCLEIAAPITKQEMYERVLPTGATYVGMCDTDIAELPSTQIMPMQRGDALCMQKYLPHRSTINRSESIRWSIEVRYERK